MTRFNPADTAFQAGLDLPEDVFPELTPKYLEEPRGRYASDGGLLVAPSSTEQVSLLLKAAQAARVPVVPYSGGTGLVGGQIA